jgi:uncharacterized protein
VTAARLRHIRELVTLAGRSDTTSTRLMCFGGAGFNDKAHAAAAADPDIRLIDLTTLYGEV